MKKNKEIYIYFGIFTIIISILVLFEQLSNLDEIWNFNFARNISNGLLPYKDFNIVTTPLTSMIGAIFLKLFGKEIIVTRILSVCLIIGIFIITHKIFKELNIDTKLFVLMEIVFILLQHKYFYLDYNYIVLLITLIILYLEIKDYNKKNFWIGILAGLSILAKQTTGLALTAILLIYKIFKIKDKEDLKKFVKESLIKLLGILIPITFFTIYLIYNKLWNHFIEYTITGIKNFSNIIPYTNLFIKQENIFIVILSIIVPITVIYMVLKSKKDNNIYTLLFFAIADLIVIYPISDISHFEIGSFITIIGLMYIISKKIDKYNVRKQVYTFIIIINMVLIGIALYFCYIKIETTRDLKVSDLDHFNNIPISDGLYNMINTTNNYIKSQEKKVYILDASAAIYMIPLNRYNKNYDLFNRGNLGNLENTPEKVLEQDAIFLIKKRGRNWQTPTNIIKYVQEHKNKIGNIGVFDIYD